MKVIEECALCRGPGPLQVSHIIPKFVGKWLKATSATGFLRNAMSANVPVQDLNKHRLLCGTCENLFSGFEKAFSERVFVPFVDDELDDQGLKQGAIDGFDYDEWLLRFVMSVQWRCMAVHGSTGEGLNAREQKLLGEFEECAQAYLMGRRSDTGRGESHVLLLQNLLSISDPIPTWLHENANTYVMRCTDATQVWAKGMLGVFTKLGPVCLYTSIVPERMVGMPDSRIRRRGILPTVQRIHDRNLVKFILGDRPAQAYRHYKVSDAQQEAIADRLAKDPARTAKSLSLAADRGNEHIQGLKEKGE